MTGIATASRTEHRPARTCAGCRRSLARTELLRYVADAAGRLRLDPLLCLRGRGVHVCADRRCLQAASARGAFARGLRRRVVPMDHDELARLALGALQATIQGRIEQGLADGRVQRTTTGDRVLDARLSTRLETLRAQARRLEAEPSGPERAMARRTEVRDS